MPVAPASPYLNRFLQPDTIVPGMFNPQNFNRFSYVRNNPILYTDPSGHAICLDGIYCGTQTNSSYQNYVHPAPSGGNSGSSGNGNSGSSSGGNSGEALGSGSGLGLGITTSDKPIPLCKQALANSTCQTISDTVGVTVFVLDGVAFIGTAIFAALAVSSLLGGSIGLGTVTAAYKIANVIEGRLGAFTFGLTLANDLLVTGDTSYSSAKSEFTLSSDVIIAGTFAATGGFYSEPFGDTFLNGAAVIHDFYRITGGEKLFDLHVGVERIYLTDSHYPKGLDIWP